MSQQRIAYFLQNLPGMSPEMILERLTSFEFDKIHISFDEIERVCDHVNERIISLTTSHVKIPAQLAILEKHVIEQKRKKMVERLTTNLLEESENRPNQLVATIQDVENNKTYISYEEFQHVYNFSEEEFKKFTGTRIRVFDKLVKRYHGSVGCPDCCRRYCCQKVTSTCTDLAIVGKVICWLTNYQFPILYQDPDVNLKLKQDLFIWALLYNRQSFAKKLWESMDRDVIAYGLFASILTRALARKTKQRFDMQYFSQALHKCADDYERNALIILTKCYRKEPDCASFLLWRILEDFGNQSLIRMAFSGKLSEFLAHDCVQNSLTKAWYKNLPDDPSWFSWWLFQFAMFLSCCILPFLKLKRYSDPIAIDRERTDFFEPDGGKFKGSDCFSKLYDFYTTPVIKFHLHKLSYFLFLIIFWAFPHDRQST